MVTNRGHPRPSPWPPVVLLLLISSPPPPLQARPLLVHSPVNVAVVFSGSSYQNEVRGRLSGENFVDLPVVVSPVTVLVNDTNPRDLLTHLCDTMATEKLHGVVFEDDVGSGAGDQVNGEMSRPPHLSHKAAHENIYEWKKLFPIQLKPPKGKGYGDKHELFWSRNFFMMVSFVTA